jgi:2'-5' RNA ligase superfamily
VTPGEPSARTYGISADLTGEAAREALRMWDYLEERYGLRGSQAALRPHVSYLIGESGQPAALAGALEGIARHVEPPAIQIEGLGVFPGASPVLFLQVAKTRELVEIHAQLLEATRGLWDGLWPHYLTEPWVPHVTLALRDLRPEQLPAVLADLDARRTHFAAELPGLDLVNVVLPTHVYLGHFPLGRATSAS